MVAVDIVAFTNPSRTNRALAENVIRAGQAA
jgi:hypothetical protein